MQVLERRAAWPIDVTDTDVDWLNQQWQLAGGLAPMTDAERVALSRYFTWVTTELVK